MKSIKLTNECRDVLLRNAINRSHQQKLCFEVNKTYNDLGDEIRQHELLKIGVSDKILSNINSEITKLLANVPESILKHVNVFNIRDYYSASFTRWGEHHTIVFNLSEYKFIPSNVNIDEEHDFYDRFTFLYDRKEKASAKLKAFKSDLGDTLQGFNTSKQLLTAWPESIELFSKEMIDSMTADKYQVALVTKGLNSDLGLPTEKKEK